MADDALKLYRYPSLEDSKTVHVETFAFPAEDDGSPFSEEVTEAYFQIKKYGKPKLSIELGDHLRWDDAAKALVLSITNGHLSFVEDRFSGTFELVVVYASGRVEKLDTDGDAVLIERGL